MADIEWNVKNAINRDVERQHLNRILKDIQKSFEELKHLQIGADVDGDSVRDIVASMVENNSEDGLSVTYNPDEQVLDFTANDFNITLQGDVTGEGTVVALRDVTIDVQLDPSLVGVGEAPIDGFPYWRYGGEWQQVTGGLEQLEEITTDGFAVKQYSSESGEHTWFLRRIEVVADELTVANADGVADNPVLGLADLANTGVGIAPVKIYTRDAKGRIEGDEDADTGDLPEGSNLYFTDTRVYEKAKDMLVAGANITLTPDDLDETITITGTGGGGGGGSVDTVTGGTGITVDNTDPANPVVAVSSAVIASLALADSSVQPGDNVSDLVNDAGYLVAADLGTAAFTDATDYATAAQGATADSALQPGDNISELVNDEGYVDAAGAAAAAPIQSIVAGTNVTVDVTDPENPVISASGGGGVTDGDKGDLTVSGSGTVWTIDNGVVTYAKIQNVTPNSLLGRTDTGSPGPIEEIPFTPFVQTILDDVDGDAVRATIGAGIVESVVAGTNVTVDNTDPANPIISAAGGGGGSTPESIEASEALTAPCLVNIWDDVGVAKIRNADASTEGYEANGYVLVTTASGVNADVYFEGRITGLSGLTIGARHYLSTTPGAVDDTAPTASGNVIHCIGVAVSATSLNFDPEPPVTIY